MQQRNLLLDILKGVAIMAVVLYHADVLPNGYLGVELFLVIAGYLTTKSVIKSREGYFAFLTKRIVRLWPLALATIASSFVIGYYFVFPWTFKLQCESVAASTIFVNNIVQYLTAGDYWNGDNLTKPLMHTWYIGIMMQFYVVYPLLFFLAKKNPGRCEQNTRVVLWITFGLSFLLYLSPLTNEGQDFYLLPSRLFEFAAGGLLAIQGEKEDKNSIKDGLGVTLMALVMRFVTIKYLDYRTEFLFITFEII